MTETETIETLRNALRLCQARAATAAQKISTLTAERGQSRVVVRIGRDGGIDVATDAPAAVYMVDENAPDDRVYLLGASHVTGAARVDAILGSDPVGHAADDHPLSNRRVRQ